MSIIRLTGFGGESPRVIPRLLADNAAQAAFNVRLDDGGLMPIRKAVQYASVSKAGAQTIYKHGEKWLAWDKVVHACEGAVAQDRLYYTGDGSPKMRVNDTIYPLAVPRPQNPLVKTLHQDNNPPASGEEDKRDVVTRHYVYTFVSDFGEESEPCSLGDSIEWRSGQTIKLSGFVNAPSGRAITKQRIYRTQTGSSGTGLYFIAERDVSSGQFIDDVPVDKFNEFIPSANWHEPPDDLSGLTSMPNGMMAAFRGKELYFCEPFRPHAWPENYVLTTDSEIVALGSIGYALIVLTKGQPYLCQGAMPEAMQMVKLEANYPCINAQGVVDLGFSIVYPSHEGLVAVDGNGQVSLISTNMFNRDDWLELNPHTMIGSQHQGRYVAFYKQASSGVETSGMLMVSPLDAPFLLRSDETACAAFYDVPTGGLYLVRSGSKDILRFDSPDGERHEMYWKSKPFYFSKPENFGVVLVESEKTLTGDESAQMQAKIAAIIAENEALLAAGSVLGGINEAEINSTPLGGDLTSPLPHIHEPFHISLIADDVRYWQGAITNKILRLPAGFTAKKWEVEISGSVPIEQITIAKTMDILKQVQG